MREGLKKLDWRFGVIVAGVVALGISGFFMLPQGDAAKVDGLGVVLKCADEKCGEVLRTTRGDVQRRATKDVIAADNPGLPCGKCGKNTLASANECPKDGTVFYVRSQQVRAADGEMTSSAGEMVCPVCGWNPTAEQRKKMLELGGKK